MKFPLSFLPWDNECPFGILLLTQYIITRGIAFVKGKNDFFQKFHKPPSSRNLPSALEILFPFGGVINFFFTKKKKLQKEVGNLAG